MTAFSPGAVSQKLHGASRLTQGNAEGALDADPVQAQQSARRGGRTENTAGSRRMKSPIVVFGGIKCQSQTYLNLIADNTGGNQIAA